MVVGKRFQSLQRALVAAIQHLACRSVCLHGRLLSPFMIARYLEHAVAFGIAAPQLAERIGNCSLRSEAILGTLCECLRMLIVEVVMLFLDLVLPLPPPG